MKKLMIAAAIVCAAVVSQAAQFDWGFTNDDDMGDYTVADNATYYLVNGSSGIGATLSTILSNEGVDAFTKAIADGGYSFNTGAFSDGELEKSTVFNSTGDYAALFVMNDGLTADKAFVYSEYDVSGNIYTPPTGKDIASFYASDWGDPDYVTGSGAGTIAAVPEPTSGLLLLLGVAGLALRRRRA